MMLYIDRIHAGKELSQALQEHANRLDTLVVALPRGGVVVGYEVATTLHLPLDIVCPRKIGSPLNPEFALGAITEKGESLFLENTDDLSDPYIQQAIEREKKEAQWRLNWYRKGRPPRNVENKTVILIDDGVATGSTMLAAIKTMQSEKAQTIIVAIPVAPIDTLERLKQEVDQIVCLMTPLHFYAVGQFYKNFNQISDEEVVLLLQTESTINNDRTKERPF